MARELNIRITADASQAKGELTQVEQILRKQETAANDASRAVGGEGGSGGLIGSLKTMAGLLAGLGLQQAVAKVAEFGSHLEDLSKKSGITIDALQNLNYAAGKNGLNLDQAVAGINQLQRRLAGDDKSAVSAVRDLGLSLDDLKAMAPDQMFVAIADKIGAIPAQGDKLQAAFQLMGRQGETLVPLLLAVDDLKARHATMTAEQVANLDMLDDWWSGFKIRILSEVGAIIGGLASWRGALDLLATAMSPTAGATGISVGQSLTMWQNFFQRVGGWVLELPTKFLTLKNQVVAYMSQMYTGVKEWMLDKFSVVVNGVKTAVEKVGDAFAWLKDVVVGRSYVPDMINDISTQFARLPSVMVLPTEAAAGSVAGAFSSMATRVGGSISGLVSSSSQLLDAFGVKVDTKATTILSQFSKLKVEAGSTASSVMEELNRVLPEVTLFYKLFTGIASWIGGGPGDKYEAPGPSTGYNPLPPSGVDDGPGGSGGGGNSFAMGTGGKYLDFGMGTPVWLHGKERVMTEAEGRAQPQTIIVQVQVDGRTIAESAVPWIPSALKAYGLA